MLTVSALHVPQLLALPEFDASTGGYLEVASHAAVVALVDSPQVEAAPADVDQQMGRAIKVGSALGIPLVFALTFAVGILGGAGPIASIAIGAWCGLFGGGMYLGTVFFLPKGGEHFERPAEWETPGTLLAKQRAAEAWASAKSSA